METFEEKAALKMETPQRGGVETPQRGGMETPQRGGVETPQRGGMETPQRGGVETPQRGGVETPQRGGVETPQRGGVETPQRGGVETPQRGGVETPQRGGVETPQRGGVETPQRGGVETPQRGGVETPQRGGVETPQRGGVETPQRGGVETPQSQVVPHWTLDMAELNGQLATDDEVKGAYSLQRERPVPLLKQTDLVGRLSEVRGEGDKLGGVDTSPQESSLLPPVRECPGPLQLPSLPSLLDVPQRGDELVPTKKQHQMVTYQEGEESHTAFPCPVPEPVKAIVLIVSVLLCISVIGYSLRRLHLLKASNGPLLIPECS